MYAKKLFLVIILFLFLYSYSDATAVWKGNDIRSISLGDIRIGGELKTRLLKNFDRLEESKYQPDHVFLTEKESGGWPGDTEGRTILGLVMDAQASHRAPLYLQEILNRLPAHLNSREYMGTIYDGMLNEQQLSGNGWLLRGLCEYYKWKKDKKVLPVIQSIAMNLFVKGKGLYKEYPIDPKLRHSQVGGASGNIDHTYRHWMLSTDIGCVYIGMDGAIQAYDLLRIPALKEVIDEMINSFLEVDLVSIKAQTHATLTACRGLMRYAGITGNKKYADEAVKRWQIYKSDGMTECFGNYNWFDRYDTWTEPCAIVDSYMLAVQLWQYTGDMSYRNDAELIYYNAIAHAQRANGGFGCDNCPGVGSKKLNLEPFVEEASWCCTMRGGEGLSRVAGYAYFAEGNSIVIPFYHSSEAVVRLPGRKFVSIVQSTGYPFDNRVVLKIVDSNVKDVCLRLAVPYWMDRPILTLNGEHCLTKVSNGFVELKRSLKKGDVLILSFNQNVRYEHTINEKNTNFRQFKVFYGPLLLGADSKDNSALHEGDNLVSSGNFCFTKQDTDIHLVPIYHLLDAKVSLKNKSSYQRQVIFN
jgi:Uncharacterized protein conserved in bacteria